MIPGLCTDLLTFNLRLRKTSARRPTDESCSTTHCLKWGPLQENDVCRSEKHVRKGEVGEKRRDEESSRKRVLWRRTTFVLSNHHLCLPLQLAIIFLQGKAALQIRKIITQNIEGISFQYLVLYCSFYYNGIFPLQWQDFNCTNNHLQD